MHHSLFVFVLCFTLAHCWCPRVNFQGSRNVLLSESWRSNGVNSWNNNNYFGIRHKSRAIFTDSCTGHLAGTGNWFNRNAIATYNLLGKTLVIDVDVSQIGCGCNAAFYLVEMPASQKSEAGDHYCDANYIGGLGCPEMDILEANKRAFKVAPHKCNGWDGTDHKGCDGAGLSMGFHYNNDYGPGSQYKINTNRKFTVSWNFQTNGAGEYSRLVTRLSQGGRSVQKVESRTWYLKHMTYAMKRMAIVIAYWGDKAGQMSWLDSPPCGRWSKCGGGGQAKFSNLRIRGGSGRATESDVLQENAESDAANDETLEESSGDGIPGWGIGLIVVGCALLVAIVLLGITLYVKF